MNRCTNCAGTTNETNSDLTFSRSTAREYIEMLGWNSLLETIQIVFDEYEIYAMSRDWYQSDAYNIKCKGAKGDAIIKLI